MLGTEWWLRAYRAGGAGLWRKAVPGTAWGVNIGRDGRLVAAAYDDGTVRWHRLSDGQELLALFVHAKDRCFIVWTPKGYYAASPGGDNLIGWHVNRGWDRAADFYPVSRFRDRFNRPDARPACARYILTTRTQPLLKRTGAQAQSRRRILA